jgi:hypothetical protein
MTRRKLVLVKSARTSSSNHSNDFGRLLIHEDRKNRIQLAEQLRKLEYLWPPERKGLALVEAAL